MSRQYKAGDNIEIINKSMGISPRKNCIFLKYIDMDDRCLVLDKEIPDNIRCWVILLKDIRMGSAQTNAFSDREREAAKNISLIYYDSIEELEDGELLAYYHLPYCDQHIIHDTINSGLHSIEAIRKYIELREEKDFEKRINLYVVRE